MLDMLSFILKFASSFIILPGAFVTLFLILACMFYKKARCNNCSESHKRIFIRIFIIFLSLAALFYVISTNWFSHLLSKIVYVPDTEDKGEYIVILGRGIDNYYGTVEIGKHTIRRLYKGFELYKSNPRKIIVTGGRIGHEISEAFIMKKTLVEMGVPEKDIIVEEFARNTFENAKYTKNLISDKPITLVTSVSHVKRSVWSFKKFFKEVYNISADVPSDFKNFYLDYLPTSGGLYSTSIIIYEIFGMLQYKIIY